MKYAEGLKKLGNAILDLLFPISCLVCGSDGTYLCEKCFAKLARLEKQECLVCQKSAPYGKTHMDCVSKNTVDGSIAALSYKDRDVFSVIRTFKYNFVSDLARPLSTALIQEIHNQNLSDYFTDFTVVPVPLHSRRQNWRGFNQALLLAEKLADKLSLQVDNKLVTRKKFTQPQTTLKAEDRKRNIENAFTITGDAANKKILLVDDVVTSGSTANELAKLLKQNHAKEVWILTAAHG
jgi:competence protein ComFC